MKKVAIALIIASFAIAANAQDTGQILNTVDFTERVINAFPDIRFDLIDDDWQNDTYLKPYLEKRLVLMAHDSLSIFFHKNMEDFKKLSTLLDSCIAHSNSGLLLALLLRNWDNTDLEKLKRVNENISDLLRNSYYGRIFEQQLENRSQKMTKIDFLYVTLNTLLYWEMENDIRLRLEYNLLTDHTINVFVVLFKRVLDKISDMVKHDMMDAININYLLIELSANCFYVFALNEDFENWVKKAFPDIRFDLIDDDWQNDTYLKPYLEKRLVLFAHDRLSILKNQATEANDTALTNKYFKKLNDFFDKNIKDFKELSTLLDSCITHSNSELLLALLLRNWDNIDPEKIRHVNENISDLSRKSYYGNFFEQKLKNRSQKMTKIDFVYSAINLNINVTNGWEMGENIKLRLEYNLLTEHYINILVITLKRGIDKLIYDVEEHDMFDSLNNILYFQIYSNSSAELHSIQELLYLH